jgi:hypothetical protein
VANSKVNKKLPEENNKMFKTITRNIQDYFRGTDKGFLLFLLLFLNVKLIVKCLAIVFVYCYKPDFRFGFRWRNPRLPLFYPVIACIGLLNYGISAGFMSTAGTVKLLFGLFGWLLCLLAIHQVKLFVEQTTVASLHRSLRLFFLLNILVTLVQLLLIVLEIHDVNPYRYQGLHQKYFIGTGDYIKGISFDTSTTNAIINAFGLFYFLNRKEFVMVLCSMGALLLTGSNTTNLILLLVFLYSFIFGRDRSAKSIMVVGICMMVVFMTNISPQNNDYAMKTIQHLLGKDPAAAKQSSASDDPLSHKTLTADEIKYRIAKNYLDSIAAVDLQHTQNAVTKNERPVLPKDNIHSPPFQHVPDSSAGRKQVTELSEMLGTNRDSVRLRQNEKLPGKILAVRECFQYFKTHPARLITGSGMGNFSSKLAFRATGLKVSGGYPQQFVQINPDFANNHLAIFLDYFGKDSGYHSVTNSPNSVYLQLLSEYGLTGLVAFLFLYLLYFIRIAQKHTGAFPLILLLLAFFFTDYWFEQLSVVVLFELLLFLQAKKTTIND